MENNKSDYQSSIVIDYIKSRPELLVGRKQEIVDVRHYLIGVLYQKFRMIEDDLAIIFKRDRSTINHAKSKIYDYRNDGVFINNTDEVRGLFPHIPLPPEDVLNASRYRIIIDFGVREYESILLKYNTLSSRDLKKEIKKILLYETESEG